MERALARVGVATLQLVLRGTREFPSRDYRERKLNPQDDIQRILPLFRRCSSLYILLGTMNRGVFRSRVTMPHLEHLVLGIYDRDIMEPLVDAIESGSPLLRSLCICGALPVGLGQHRRLLNRLWHLEMKSPPDDSITFFHGLQNLRKLV
jgi:hypothetical protein